MAKHRASFVKRQREIAKKEQREAKFQRRTERRAAAAEAPAEGSQAQQTEVPAPDSPALGGS
jgi:hypothetical protein